MQRFHGKITKETINSVNPLFVGDIYEDDIWQYKNAQQNPIQYIDGRNIEDCVELNGNFLFLKKEKDLVYFGTDQNSVHPLYYSLHKGDFYYSWSIDELVKLLPEKPEMNWKNIVGWLVTGPTYFNNETRLKNVYRLEAGNYLRYDGEKVWSTESKPFIYSPDYSLSFDDCLYMLIATLRKAIERRLRANQGSKPVLFSLSGGIDSRIVLSELVKQTKNVITYTYGEKEFAEKFIAKQVAELLKVPWLDIEIDKWGYLNNAEHEAEMSGGMSFFKHAPQFHFSEKLKSSDSYGVMFGSALDLLIGNSYPIVDRTYNDKQLMFLFRVDKQKEWEDVANQSLDDTFKVLDTILGDNSFDVSCSYHIETRVKHWYNWNLIYHLRNHKLLLPTYDKDFLQVVSMIPANFREDDSLRIELLKRMNYEASKIIYNATMQPAYIKNPEAGDFEVLQKVKRKAQQDVWSKQGIYIPSNDFDFNFLEWTRVYDQYRTFVEDLLFSSESILMSEFLDYDKTWYLWNEHLKGERKSYKELMMLCSAELCCKHFRR